MSAAAAARAVPSVPRSGANTTSRPHRWRRASRHRASTSPQSVDVDRETADDDEKRWRTLSAPPAWALASDNPPLKGNFAPVVGECVVDDLVVDGVLPRGLDGVYLRNGPNPAHEPLLGARRYHWFDGDGMVHWIRLSPGGSGAAPRTRHRTDESTYARAGSSKRSDRAPRCTPVFATSIPFGTSSSLGSSRRLPSGATPTRRSG